MLEAVFLLVIFFVALLVFGPKKLPELGKDIGHAAPNYNEHAHQLPSCIPVLRVHRSSIRILKDGIKETPPASVKSTSAVPKRPRNAKPMG